GTIVMAKEIDDIISFDPAQSYEFSDTEVDANVYRKLVSPDLEDLSKIDPDLASAWEVSADGKTFTFHLTQDALFPSGKPMTAADAEFSLHRVVTLNLTPGFILTQFGFTKDNVAGLIRATDPHTLVMELPKPAATSFVLYCLSANVGAIVEKETALSHQEKNDLGNHWLTSHSAGNGPYQLTSWSANDHIILDANPHAATAPLTKRVFIRHVKDPATQVLMVRRGDADIARDLTPDLLKSVAGDPSLYRLTTPSTNQMYLAGNAGYAPFAKIEVRQAIKWAIDYAGIQTNIVPATYIVNQGFEPTMILGAATTNPFQKDPDKARALLAQAGYAGGFTATLDHFSDHPYTDIAAAIQADLGALGIKVSLQPGTRSQVFTKMRARQHQLILSEWYPDYFDPNSNAQAFCANPDDSNNSPLKIIAWRCHFYNPTLTAEVTEAAQELDTAKRVAIYHRMQQQFWDTSPIAFMLQENLIAIVRKNVTGFVLGAQSDFTRYNEIRKA
ncbi:MAG TPA: ABC transporter substrate-binding protein, partial [Acetobacteraceae bacterium]|nr:ABC transporter substrate-binding protein [Acetobacteraceae bacterium]